MASTAAARDPVYARAYNEKDRLRLAGEQVELAETRRALAASNKWRRFADIVEESLSGPALAPRPSASQGVRPGLTKSGTLLELRGKDSFEDEGRISDSSISSSSSEEDTGWGAALQPTVFNRTAHARPRRASLELPAPHNRKITSLDSNTCSRRTRRCSFESRAGPRGAGTDPYPSPRLRACSGETPGCPGSGAGTPRRGRRLPLEEDREAAVYYGMAKGVGGEGGGIVSRASDPLARRKSGSFREKDTIMTSADPDLLVEDGAGGCRPAGAGSGGHAAGDGALPRTPARGRQRGSLDLKRSAPPSESWPRGKGNAAGMTLCSGWRNSPPRTDLPTPQEADYEWPTYGYSVESSTPPTHDVPGHSADVFGGSSCAARQCAPFTACAPQKPGLWEDLSGTETEEMETSEASDASQFLRAADCHRGRAPTLRAKGHGRERRASVDITTRPRLAWAVLLRQGQPGSTTDEAETSDASDEADFLGVPARLVSAARRTGQTCKCSLDSKGKGVEHKRSLVGSFFKK